MKIVLLGDTHFGIKNFNKEFYKNQIDFFEKQFFPYLIENNIKCVFQLGDLFDNRKIIDIDFFQNFINDFGNLLKKWNGKFYVLTGNHDIYYKNTREISSLNILEKLIPIIHINEDTIIEIDNIKFALIPWITVNEKISEEKSNEIYNSDYILGHFEFAGFQMIKGVENKSGMNPKDFKNFKAVFSGHFHLRQNKGNIYYIGTPYQLDWNDSGDDKGFYVLDIKLNQLEFIENKFSKKFVKYVITKDINLNELNFNSKNEYKIILKDKIDIKEFLEKLKENNIKFSLIDKTIDFKVSNEIKTINPEKLLFSKIEDEKTKEIMKEILNEAKQLLKD